MRENRLIVRKDAAKTLTRLAKKHGMDETKVIARGLEQKGRGASCNQ